MTNEKKIKISGTGCALADFIFNGISFNSTHFRRYLSKEVGDGGLSPGKLIFTSDLEKFSGRTYTRVLEEITVKKKPDLFNIGGPSIVSLVHAAQLLGKYEYEVKFFGITGNDDISSRIFDLLRKTPIDFTNYLISNDNSSPFTIVLSDPDYNNGQGERTFINHIGAASDMSPEHLDESFFNSNIVCFGGTALVPGIHDCLTDLLFKAKKQGCITLVNTVFDFRNEKRYPGSRWPLVKTDEDFSLIDTLIMDCEEAIRISGQPDIENAARFFTTTDVGSFVITNGPNKIHISAQNGLFLEQDLISLPISSRIKELLESGIEQFGDTTGCGDNFAGGVIASLAWQLKNKGKSQFDIVQAVSWGVASGGFACFYVGGTILEEFEGQKRARISDLKDKYLKQMGY